MTLPAETETAAPDRAAKPRRKGSLARLLSDPLGALGLFLIALTVLGAECDQPDGPVPRGLGSALAGH